MAYIIEIPNPFQPFKDIKKTIHPGGISIRNWLQDTYPDFVEFSVPTICVVNGKALLRADWNRVIQPNDVVNFVTMPNGPVAVIVISIVIAAAAIALSLFLTPPRPGETNATSDPVFSLKGQSNEIRLGEPIEVNYGRNRIYPSYAARPYFQYIDNDQFLHSLFCLGQGYYEIAAIQIGDSLLSNYEEASSEVVAPGGAVTLFPTAVYTAPEAGNITLYAPDQSEYVAPGWEGPFPANGTGTTTTKIEVDIILPKGLYNMDTDGGIYSASVAVEGEMRLIDNDGNPLGDWSALLSELIVATTTTPQRKTFSVTVAEGRYEVRMRRTGTAGVDIRHASDTVWDGLRAFLTDEPDWGEVTLLAVKIKATNNLNSRSQNQINVVATRKLSIYESGGWSASQTTRSIVWAFVDIFKSLYGGRVADTYLDLDALVALDALYAAREDYFDYTFRDLTTVWEAARTVARVGRAIPILSGSLISMKRDGPLTVPVALFNQDNIIKGSFQYVIRLSRMEDTDSIEAEYTDADTGYKQETVLAELESTADNPRNVRMLGVQDRNHAYRDALYLLATERYVREVVVFDTGLEGFIPSFGDLIAVVHDVPRWGQGGYVVHAEVIAGTNMYHLWLSEPVSFDDSADYVVMLRGRQGEVLGPFTAVMTSDEMQIEIASTESDELDFLLGGENEPMLFLFGLASQITKYMKITQVEPQGGEVVRITAVNYAEEVHSFDSNVPSALPADTWPASPDDLPTITRLSLSQVPGIAYQVQASWAPVLGVSYYVVQSSADGVNWQEIGKTTIPALVWDCLVGLLYVRVAGVSTGQGPWTEETISISPLMGLFQETEDESDVMWRISWFATTHAVNYVIRIYDNTESEPYLWREVIQAGISYSYSFADAEADAGSAGNLADEMIVTVNPIYTDGEAGTDPASLELHNLL